MARADKRLRPARPAVRKGHRLPTDETGAFPQDEESYRRLVELSPDAIAVHAEGRLVYANPAAAELIGAASPEELIGMPILDIVHPAFHGIVLERTRQEVEEGRAVPLLEEKFVRLDGAVVDVEVAGIPITFRGKRAGQVM